MLLIGLFIALASVFHNTVKVFVNDTSFEVFGPYDWATVIIGALALLVGIVLLTLSRGTSKAS